MSSGRPVFLVALSLPLGAVGCEQLIGANFDDAERRPDAVASSCDPIKPPVRPDIQGAGEGTSFGLVVVETNYNEDETDGGVPEHLITGYDVDDNCANQGDPPPCLPAPWTGGVPTDGVRGQDNAVGKVLFEQARFLGIKALTSELMNARLEAGDHAPLALFRISDWGGLSDDEQVTVDWYPTAKPSVGGNTPRFDGTDQWPVLESSLVGTAGPGDGHPDVMSLPPSRFRDENAYVNKFELVARFDVAPVVFANFPLDSRQIVLTGKLNRDPASQKWELTDGLVSGRSPADLLVEMLPVGAFETTAVPLCPDNANWDAVKHLVCSVADSTLPGQPEPDGVCGATTFAIGITARESTFGPAIPDPERTSPCPPELNPADDTCQDPAENPVVFADE